VPSKSAKQRLFWRIAYHSEKFRKQHGISFETAKEWYESDERLAKERAEEERKRRAND
jgi:hypothetical protein